ncbi:MAG: OmpA family protein, partial [Deltaproteobacteria bacterium]|nr:OmpA family protein [Deltaproteobacteria bacterium]
SADKKIPPVIKKVIKKGHGGHHGGSWKVAYADFVTAMMAYFLVMWLLAISSEQGKASLAEYFNELSLSDAVFNGGQPSVFEGNNSAGVLVQGGCFELTQKGQELEEKAKRLDELEKSLSDRSDSRPDMGATRPTDRPQDPNLTELPEGQEGGEGSTQTGVAPGQGWEVEPGMGEAGNTAEAIAAKEKFMSDLAESVASGLSGAGMSGTDLGGQFMVDSVPGGIRVQIMDKEGQPIFMTGQPRLTPLAMVILGTVAERLKTIPNKMAIEGHTDSVQTLSQELTNWELSTARASAARRFLARHGLSDDRLTMVAGFSSTQPLPGTNPTDPVNRRVAIIIWDQPVTPAAVVPGPPRPQDFQSQPQPSAASPPSAGSPSEPQRPRPRPRPRQERPSQESLEQMLLEETLRKAAEPDATTTGPSPGSDLGFH